MLVPSLLLSSNPQEISQLLVDGIFSYFSSVCGYRVVRVVKKKHPPHNVSLKDIKRKKKEAKIALCRARKEGVAPGAIGALAMQFFSLVRSHSKLKRESEVQSACSNAKKARLVSSVTNTFRSMLSISLMSRGRVRLHQISLLSQPTASFLRCTAQAIGTLSSHLGCQHPHLRRLR